MRATFAVVYRWRVAADRHEKSRVAWDELAEAIRRERGGLGSRLHRNPAGEFVAYAQWPDRETWQRAQALPSPLPEVSERMRGLIVERFAPLELEVDDDRLSLVIDA